MKNTTVLVVDDSRMVLISLKTQLEKRGYNVLTADNVLSAFSIAAWNDIDCCVLDYSMPNYKGTDAESFFIERGIPTLYYSAFDTAEIREKTELPIVSKMETDRNKLFQHIDFMTRNTAAVYA